MNLRESLLAKVANPLVPVEVDGTTVYVRKLTYSARLDLFDVVIEKDMTREQRRAAMALITKNAVLHCVCDSKGVPLFTADDWEALESDPSGTIDKLANAVLSANNATAGAQEAAGKQSQEVVAAASESSSV